MENNGGKGPLPVTAGMAAESYPPKKVTSDLSLAEVRALLAQRDVPQNLVDLIPWSVFTELEDYEKGLLVELSGAGNVHPDILFMPSFIAQTGLPEKPRGMKDRFTRQLRQNGQLSVEYVCTSSEDHHELASDMPARCLLAYINSQALRTQNRTVFLGRHLKTLIKDEIGATYSKGPRGTATTFRKQLENLCHLFIDVRGSYQTVTAGGLPTTAPFGQSMDIISTHLVWGEQDFNSSEGAWVSLSMDYYLHLKEHAVPLTTQALRTLIDINSSLAFDIFVWSQYRQHKLNDRKEKMVRVSWQQLHQQLAPHIRALRDFRNAAKDALKELHERDLVTGIFSQPSGLILTAPKVASFGLTLDP